MTISFSHALNSSFPHIGQNGTRFKTHTSSFGCPMPSSFIIVWLAIFRAPQNISRRYFVLHRQPPYLVHKKMKQMHLYMTNKDVQAIVQIFIDPRFEIKDFLNELWNEWTILGKHECFHKICHDIIILFFQFFQKISKTSINIFMCAPNYKKPQLNFKNFVGS
jgi:hypothetical protein